MHSRKRAEQKLALTIGITIRFFAFRCIEEFLHQKYDGKNNKGIHQNFLYHMFQFSKV